MDELQKAYKEWQKLAPYHFSISAQTLRYMTNMGERIFTERAHWDGSCCMRNHFKTERRPDGDILIPLADSEVCQREQAWRKYCRVRDGIKHSS